MERAFTEAQQITAGSRYFQEFLDEGLCMLEHQIDGNDLLNEEYFYRLGRILTLTLRLTFVLSFSLSCQPMTASHLSISASDLAIVRNTSSIVSCCDYEL